MDVDQDRLVDTLGSALRHGGSALSDVPELLERVLRDKVWQHFTTRRGDPVTHERFADFVTTPPLDGLGASVRLIQNVVNGIECKAKRRQVQDLLDRALQNPAHIHHDDNIVQVKAPQGNSADRALRKLRADAPELHAQVLAGILSAHAAMVQAGFRPRTFTVRPEPTSAARTLRKHMTADQLAELARLLTEDN